MTYNHQLPVGTLVTCVYDPHDREHPGYPIAAIIIETRPGLSIWRILRGGWNHSSTINPIYGCPSATDPDYHSFVVHTPDTFPYPELLI